MLSMTHGEKHLARLGQYKPAQDLRNMIDKLQPKEQKAFEKEYNTKLAKMRAQLKRTKLAQQVEEALMASVAGDRRQIRWKRPCASD